MSTIEHIEQLKAELKGGCWESIEEKAAIEAELAVALAQLAV